MHPFQCEADICRQLSHMAALCFKKQKSFQFVITYIWWQKRPLGFLQRPHRKLRASIHCMGEEERCMELRAQRDRKQLSFSWQKAKDVPQQHSQDTPEQDLPAETGQGKRKCIVSPRLNFTSYYIRATDYRMHFFSVNNLVAEKQSLKATKTSSKFSSSLVFNFGWHDMLIAWIICIVWVKK